MNYELLKQLRENGFKQRGLDGRLYAIKEEYKNSKEVKQMIPTFPTLEELIEAIEPYPLTLMRRDDDRTPEGHLKFSCWRATTSDCEISWKGEGQTPSEAVAQLWLNIKNNVYVSPPQPIFGLRFIQPEDPCMTLECPKGFIHSMRMEGCINKK